MKKRSTIPIFIVTVFLLISIISLDKTSEGELSIIGLAGIGIGEESCPCPGGIEPEECDPNNLPRYCEYANELETECVVKLRCNICGCPEGMNCNIETGTCNAPETTCTDRTPVESCSENKPKYCTEEKTLVNACEICGCPLGEECISDGTCKEIIEINEQERDIGDVIKLLDITPKIKEEKQVEDYTEYVLDIEEVSLVKLVAPVIEDAIEKLPEKPIIEVESFEKEDIQKSPELTDIVEEKTEEDIPEKIIKITAIPKPPEDIKLSPPKEKAFEMLLIKEKINKEIVPRIILDLRNIM